MANIIVKPPFLLRKRFYVVVEESLRSQKGGTTVKAKSASDNNGNKEEIFWMRDPKSGNWIPENHFGEVDAAELREKFLPRHTKSSNQLN
ncbi:hypothetical protein E2542_SST14094 [Spatholobus suberectus]|nr:hypothetical protein E2542_SST14094 [Spatholobus suberectus]